MTLSLPENATLTFDAPEMNKLKEATQGDNYQYVATTYGKADPRFNLSIYSESKACPLGDGLKSVTDCFVKMNSRNSSIVAKSTKRHCREQFCEVSYTTLTKVGTREIEVAHINIIMVYAGQWVDVHFSITLPTPDDAAVSTKLADSLVLGIGSN